MQNIKIDATAQSVISLLFNTIIYADNVDMADCQPFLDYIY